MDILDDMGVSKLSAKCFFLKWTTPLTPKSLQIVKKKWYDQFIQVDCKKMKAAILYFIFYSAPVWKDYLGLPLRRSNNVWKI